MVSSGEAGARNRHGRPLGHPGQRLRNHSSNSPTLLTDVINRLAMGNRAYVGCVERYSYDALAPTMDEVVTSVTDRGTAHAAAQPT